MGKNASIGATAAFALPPGLEAVQDKPDGHVTIYPVKAMPLSVYQTLLNNIPWVNVTGQYMNK